MSSRLAAGVVALAAACLLLAIPQAAQARSCKVGNDRSYGTTYVLKIGVKGVSCRSGKALIRAFHDCRPGKKGRCARVSGFACTERRFNAIPTSYDSDVTCAKGSKQVTHRYTQFT
jgi:hypothetical protein